MTPGTPESARPRVILSAFGLHTGGGAVLLREVLDSLGPEIGLATLDWRIAPELAGKVSGSVVVVPSRLLPRLRALWRVARAGTDATDRLFCLNSLPPLVRSRARTIVYVHSQQFAGMMSGIRFPLFVRARLWLDRRLFAWGRRNIDEIWVQTETMAIAMARVVPHAEVHVLPFVDAQTFLPPAVGRPPGEPLVFFYPADELAHKNHVRLFEAWGLLAQSGHTMQLRVTLPGEAFGCLLRAAGAEALAGRTIVNLGPLPRAEVLARLRQSDALVFPSVAETFGLPMVEARAAGIPILAGELDFVRDVCEPVETFDPASARSIARAVLRHAGQHTPPRVPATGAEVAARLLRAVDGPADGLPLPNTNLRNV